MSLTNDQITAKNFKDFYDRIKPYLGISHAGFTPIGTVIAVMGNAAPTHYLACNGQVVNIADYPELAAYFAEQFETANHFGGDGVTTFGIPDLRGEFLRGTGTNSHSGEGSGADVGVHQAGTSIPRIHTTNGTGGYVTYGKGLSVSNTDAYVIEPTSDKTYYYPKTESVQSADSSSNTIKTYTTRPTNTSVLYCIATKNIFMDAALSYSASEQVVGTWINGKPLYQKTVNFGALPNATSKQVAHNISNVDKIIDISGCAFGGDANGTCWPLPYLGNQSSHSGVSIYADATRVMAVTETDRSSISASYITIRYIKTTD